jgi:hypothetical protein
MGRVTGLVVAGVIPVVGEARAAGRATASLAGRSVRGLEEVRDGN